MKSLVSKPFFWLLPFVLLGAWLLYLPRTTSANTGKLTLFEAKWQLGAMRMQQARIPMEGILLLAKTARQHPERPDAALKLGEMALGTGQYNKAVQWYQLAAANTTGNEQAVSYLRMSDAYFALAKHDSTLWALNKIFEISTDSVLLRTVKQQLKELQNLSNK
jgi:hypothetical protein